MIRVLSRFVGNGLPAALCILFLTGGASYANWKSITQNDRNSRIVTQGLHDIGFVGGACKPWVYDVVRVASNLAGGPTVYLPATTDNGNGWYWVSDPYGHTVSYGQYPLSLLVPGMIIQMRIRLISGGYGPHTAIVIGNSAVNGGTLTFVESNYNGGYVVKTRSITYSAFTSSLEPTNHYTVYVIQ
jgi:hypothetical protein